MTRACTSGGSGAIAIAPVRASRARVKRSAASVCNSNNGMPSSTHDPTLTWQRTPAVALTASLAAARPAPSRQAATPIERASSR